MTPRSKPALGGVELRPSMGGKLMTGLSSESAGALNWTICRDWRRDLEQLIRSEGFDLFTPNPLGPPDQPPTGGQPITLIAMARRLNGQIAVVVGTQSTLWRYTGVADMDWNYAESGYVDDHYYEDPPGVWMEIGSGFSPGRRWEAVSINGYLVLNNGIDLPMTYQVQERTVVPIYELREQGVASVGTIEECNNLLVCGDIKLIKEASPFTVSGTAETDGSELVVFSTETPHGLNTGAIVLVSGAPAHPIFNGTYTITVTGPTTFTYNIVAQGGAFADAQLIVRYDLLTNLMNGPDPYGLVDDSLVDHYADRALWSAPNQPRRFGAIIPAAVNVFTDGLTLKYPVKSIEAGMDILIIGAGINGSNLQATVVYARGLRVTVSGQAISTSQASAAAAITAAQNKYDAALGTKSGTAQTILTAQESLKVAQEALIANPGDLFSQQSVLYASAALDAARKADADAANEIATDLVALTAAKKSSLFDTEFMAADMFGGIAGKFEDLDGDGSAILKMKKLRTVLVVYTETTIYIGTFTANSSDSPWDFQMVVIPNGTALHFKDTVVNLTGAGRYENGFAFGGAAHIYAGRNSFYRFDLTNQVPMELPEFQVCQDTFFKAAKAVDVFAVDNPGTKEIWFCFQDYSGEDKMLRWDYRFGTFSTSSMAITAGCGVIRPEDLIEPGQTEQWFAMGTSDGKLLRYGFVASDAVDTGEATISKPANSAIVTSGVAVFTARMVGWSIVTDQTETVLAITGYISPTQVVVLGASTVINEAFTVIGSIFHRNNQPYDSVLQSGLDGFGSADSLKVMNRYSVMLGSNSVDGALSIHLRTATNPRRVQDTLTLEAPKPQETNMFPLRVQGYYLGDRIVASGINNPLRLVCRIFGIKQRDQRGFDRH